MGFSFGSLIGQGSASGMGNQAKSDNSTTTTTSVNKTLGDSVANVDGGGVNINLSGMDWGDVGANSGGKGESTSQNALIGVQAGTGSEGSGKSLSIVTNNMAGDVALKAFDTANSFSGNIAEVFKNGFDSIEKINSQTSAMLGDTATAAISGANQYAQNAGASMQNLTRDESAAISKYAILGAVAVAAFWLLKK